MLHFIIGRKNSGKTTTAHRILGKRASEGKETMLIVPRQYTFDSDKSILHLLGPKIASEVEVLSFTRLAHIALTLYGGLNKPVAGNVSRLIYMSVAIESLCDELKVYSRHRKDIALIRKMLSFVDDMKNEGITAQMLEESAESVSNNILREKIKEASLIYRTYEAVTAENAFDDADLLAKVYDILCGEAFFEGKTIVIDGFPYFTHDELKLISLMMKKAEDVYITLCLDKLDISCKTGAFPYIQLTARKLMRLAGNDGIKVAEPIVCTGEKEFYNEDILHLEKNLYEPLFTAYEKESKNITVITAASFLDECDAVARKIKELIRDENYRCRDIAVVFRSDESYERQLKLAFKTYDIPFFEDKRQEITNQPLINLVRSLLAICAEGFDSDSVFRYMKTYLAGLSDSECAEIENYCFMWDISGKKWLDKWEYNPEGFGRGMKEKQLKELSELNALREKTVNPINAFREKIKENGASDIIKSLYEFLRENHIDENLKAYALSLEGEGYAELAAEQEQIWDILMEIFDEMAIALGDRKVSAKRLYEIFELAVSEKTLGKLPDGFDEVSIVDAPRMLTKNAKVTFVVGLNSGSFPENQSDSGLFTSFEKKCMEDTGLSMGESISDKSLKERFLLYNALSSASERLCLSWCIMGQGDEKKTKSEGISLTEKIIPYYNKTVTGEEDFLELIQSEKSAFRLMAEKYRSSDRESESLYAFFSEKEKYRSVIESIGRAVYKEPYEIKNDETAIKLFGKDLKFSASQTEAYRTCPFMYFCRYGLGANPRIKAKLDAAQGGTLVHHVLEILLKKYRGQEFLSLTDEEIEKEISICLEEYMRDRMGGSDSKDSRFNYIYSRTLKVLKDITERLRSEFAESDFEPCDFELSIKDEGDVKPFTLALDTGSVQFRGIVDRVDRMDLDGKRFIRIVDYKTGGKTFELSDVLEGLNMQMLLYLIAIWRKGEGEYENIIPAGILYFPAKMSTVSSVSRYDSEEIKKENRYKAGKMNGMILSEYDMVSHMDKEGKGLFIPVTVDKRNGKIKGKFIDLATMEKLGEKMDSIIRNMGNSIHSGQIQAHPVCGSSYTDVCSWCDYKEVCLEENPEKRYITKIPHDECFELLEKGGEIEE